MKKMILIVSMIACCICGSGCGEKGDIVGLVDVAGKITYNGAPVEGASVAFSPASPSNETRSAAGRTEVDGSFYLITHTSRGILPGSYKVTVSKKTEPPKPMSSEEIDAYVQQNGKQPLVEKIEIKDLLPEKYGKTETSGLSYEITKGMKSIEITLE